jgi:hypothetical protein
VLMKIVVGLADGLSERGKPVPTALASLATDGR